ncbi:hypothetical protein [Prosthecobacter sp.]|uniref:hypothetical protein n=1 Tax=Prosthecobacter sp. TaxID=1965333 RepID=UPI003783494B
MRLKFPVLWTTVLAFACVAVVSKNLVIGGFVLAVVLPVVLGCQWLVRRVMVSLRYSVWFRRTVMLVPALVVALGLGFVADFMNISTKAPFVSTNPRAAVSLALAGHVPEGLRELRVSEDAWTDYVAKIYFECDPASLRGILEKMPFKQAEYGPETFSFRQTPFADLHAREDVTEVVMYWRMDLGEETGHCVVYTDKAFSFAYVEYAAN